MAANKPNLSGKNVKTSASQLNAPRIKAPQPLTVKPKLRQIPSTTHTKRPNTIDSVTP